jgi:carbon starvation protein
LFVTIACGAVSGFHSLVSSGTTVRQLNRETDALPVGYGAMLTEGALAILVVMACVAGLGAGAWQPGGAYASWGSIKGAGLAVQLHAVVQGGACFLAQLGIPQAFGTALLAVTIVAFALTTLDTGTRLLRFNVEAICRSVRLEKAANRYVASAVAVGTIAFFGLVPAGKTLWTLFGTTNQLLAGLTLLAVSVFLYKLRKPVVYTFVPMILMLAMSVFALTLSIIGFWDNPKLSVFNKWSLTGVAVVVLAMSLWLVVEGLVSFTRGRGGLKFEEAPPGPAERGEEQAIDSAHIR